MSGKIKIKRSLLVPLIGIILISLLVGIWWGIPHFLIWRANSMVSELCKKDGGIKIYNTVKLSPNRFNKWGQVNFFKPNLNKEALGKDFQFVEEITFIKKGYPSIVRYHYKILNMQNGKILGETVCYERRGGDPIGPWEGSSFTCPNTKIAGVNALLKAIFLKSNYIDRREK